MKIEPYLFFNGRCEEAIEFYKMALGAEVAMLMRFKDAPAGDGEGHPMSKPELAEKIMHADLKIGDSHVLLSDGMGAGPLTFVGFGLSITAPDDTAAEKLFAAISAGGQVRQPLMKTFFASKFGMAADKFGVSWMVLAGR